MREYGDLELRRVHEKGSRFGCVKKELAARTVDDDAAKTEFVDGSFEFGRRIFALEGIDRRETDKAVGVRAYDLGQVIVHRSDRRHSQWDPVGGNERWRGTEDPSIEVDLVEFHHQGVDVRDPLRDSHPTSDVLRERIDRWECWPGGADIMRVEVNDSK
jgi:hypothetical protein